MWSQAYLAASIALLSNRHFMMSTQLRAWEVDAKLRSLFEISTCFVFLFKCLVFRYLRHICVAFWKGTVNVCHSLLQCVIKVLNVVIIMVTNRHFDAWHSSKWLIRIKMKIKMTGFRLKTSHKVVKWQMLNKRNVIRYAAFFNTSRNNFTSSLNFSCSSLRFLILFFLTVTACHSGNSLLR